jgi:hypothetical protein
MTPVFTPERWAFEITHVLNAAFGADRFPIERFPDDPIVGVRGDILPTFDGALFKAPAGRKGWGHHLQQSHHLERADQLHARTRIRPLPAASPRLPRGLPLPPAGYCALGLRVWPGRASG